MAALHPRFQWALELLPIRPRDRILEIGCGPGALLAAIAERLTTGCVLGIDRSATATARARVRAAAAIRAGRAAIATGPLATVALGAPFDLALAFNVGVFARGAERELARLRAHLRPRGALYLFFDAPAWARAEAAAAAVARNLAAAGFAARTRTNAPLAVCVIGTPRRATSRA